jgi:hypothetical protein
MNCPDQAEFRVQLRKTLYRCRQQKCLANLTNSNDHPSRLTTIHGKSEDTDCVFDVCAWRRMVLIGASPSELLTDDWTREPMGLTLD